ncbi:MAG: hypothetical protein LBH31_05855 [Burkholderiaceae bacterium]|nr:hypothetical protein [Burkholderiaceae bacterium]
MADEDELFAAGLLSEPPPHAHSAETNAATGNIQSLVLTMVFSPYEKHKLE